MGRRDRVTPAASQDMAGSALETSDLPITSFTSPSLHMHYRPKSLVPMFNSPLQHIECNFGWHALVRQN